MMTQRKRKKPAPGKGDASPRGILTVGISGQLEHHLQHRTPAVSVTAAPDGATALKLLREHRWQALVVHHDAPGLNGVELLTRVRGAGMDLPPILFCAARGTPADRLALLTDSLGAHRIFFEPLSLRDIAREVDALLGLSAPQAAGVPAPTLNAALGALWERAKPAMQERFRVIEKAGVAILHGTLTAEAREEAKREAHKLAGSLGTYGFPQGTTAARILEDMLEASSPLDALRYADAVMALEGVLSTEPVAAEAQQSVEPHRPPPQMAIVAEDAEESRAIAEHAARRGLRTTIVSPLRMTSSAFQVCDAILWVSGLEHLAGPDVQEVLSASRAPLVVVARGNAFLDRVEATRLGARVFLNADATPMMIIDAVSDLLAPADGSAPRVLAVDDDATVLSMLERVLGTAGFRVTTLSDPLQFWEQLAAVGPDVIMLDHDMPGVTGLELCRVIRSDPASQDLPVLMLTARTDAETIQRAFQAGADDFISKPVVGPEVVSRLRNRLERKRLNIYYAQTDQVSGVATRRRLTDCIEQYIEKADLYAQPVSLAIINIDDFRAVNAAYGQDGGDAVLREAGARITELFTGENTVARWSGDGFAVAMYGMACDDAVHRTAELLESLRDRGVAVPMGTHTLTFCAGVAQYVVDGANADELYSAAEEALARAKQAGAGRIMGATAAPERDLVDVLVVEDDDTVADLVIHALKLRGYTVQWINDGVMASQSLTNTDSGVRARVVLLDVDLPGLDGISLLRELRRTGVLDRTRVIMLTARSTEPEVLKALELGAFDHVSKPFSIPVLLQRVRRALAV